ncbi:MAG: putative transposase [Lentimonas sp.]|jgi:putative transposase
MACKRRIEYAGSRYPVINRGNYRSWVFDAAGARKSFLNCLEQACHSMEWRLYGWCLRGDHYHLCIETPQSNLVEGLRWLQSTLANRFNRFRQRNGHVFQGRYKAILLDGDAIGGVCHYMYLNPVRAGFMKASALEGYSDSSFAALWEPRWARALAGGLAVLGRESDELLLSRKGAACQVGLARWLREHHLVLYRWIAENLSMGAPSYVERRGSCSRKKPGTDEWEILQKHGKLY